MLPSASRRPTTCCRPRPGAAELHARKHRRRRRLVRARHSGKIREQSRLALHQARELADQSEAPANSALGAGNHRCRGSRRAASVRSPTSPARRWPTVDSLPPARDFTGSTAIDLARPATSPQVLGAVAGALAFAFVVALTGSRCVTSRGPPRNRNPSAGVTPTSAPRAEPARPRCPRAPKRLLRHDEHPPAEPPPRQHTPASCSRTRGASPPPRPSASLRPPKKLD